MHKLLPDFSGKESSGLIIVFRSYFRCSAWRPSQDQDLLLAKKRASSKVLSLESLQDEFQSEENYQMQNCHHFVLSGGSALLCLVPAPFFSPLTMVLPFG